MRSISAITGREWLSYTSSPVLYVVAGIYLALCGILFSLILFNTREASLSILFQNMSFLLVFVTPLLTMRLLAEERRSGTMELLLTLPFRDSDVVLGKFLGALLVLMVMHVPTLWYIVIIRTAGNAMPDPGPLLTGYLGIMLQGGVLLALGLLASALTSNQVVAAVISLAVGLGLWLIGALSSGLGPGTSTVLEFISLPARFEQFSQGIVELRSIVFYLSLAAGLLFLTYTILQTRRWW